MLHLSSKGPLCKQVPRKVKKLVAVLVASTSMTEKTEELERVPCIWYPITLKDQTEALLDSRSKVNAMSQAFAQQLGLKIRKTNVGAQKINGTTLETYGMVISTFFMLDKDSRERFFEESFPLANVKPDIVLGMPFLTMSYADIDFQDRDLQWRSYITEDVLLTTRRVDLIGKKGFVTAALDPKHETFIVHVATLNVASGDEVYPSRRA